MKKPLSFASITAMMLGVVAVSVCRAQLAVKAIPISEQQRKAIEKLVDKSINPAKSLVSWAPTRPSLRKPVSVPLEIVAGRFYLLKMKLNGEDVLAYMDWGAGTPLGLPASTVLSVKARVGAEPVGMSTLGGKEHGRCGIVQSVRVGGAEFTNVPFVMSGHEVVVEFCSLRLFQGQAIVGMPFLAPFRKFGVNLKDGRLYLGHNPLETAGDVATPKTAPVVVIPVVYKNNGLQISLDIEGQKHTMTVDLIGCPGVVLLGAEAAKRFNRSHKMVAAGESSGFGEKGTLNYQGVASILETGGYRLTNVPVNTAPMRPR